MSFGNVVDTVTNTVTVVTRQPYQDSPIVLSAGLTLIPHRLGLRNPLAVTVVARDATTGLEITGLGVVLQDTDSLSIRASRIITNVNIVVTG
jgi:hypothetical protein